MLNDSELKLKNDFGNQNKIDDVPIKYGRKIQMNSI